MPRLTFLLAITITVPLLLACGAHATPEGDKDAADHERTVSVNADANDVTRTDDDGATGERPPDETDKVDRAETLAEGGYGFAFDLFHQITEDEQGNVFFSPSSIRTALAMTWAGARGQTEQQMRDVLRFGVDGDRVHDLFARLIDDLNDPGTDEEGNPHYELAVANALWGQADYPFREDFVNLLNDRYAAGLHEVDFVTETEPSRQRINDWVAEQTRDRIRDLMPEGSITPDSRLVLTNAIYFLGGWEHTFNENRTTDATFHLPDGGTTEVPTMRQRERFRMMRGDDVKLLELPYRGGEMSMVVILPREGEEDEHPGAALQRLQEAGRLTDANLHTWMEQLAHRPRGGEVEVHLPRFSFTSEMSLNQALSAMGMRDAFDESRADFTGIASVEDLFISAVQHKAFVKVDEEGTEAAAATGIAVGVTSLPPEPETFHVDRPFLFVIRHHESGGLLFMGRVTEPTEE